MIDSMSSLQVYTIEPHTFKVNPLHREPPLSLVDKKDETHIPIIFRSLCQAVIATCIRYMKLPRGFLICPSCPPQVVGRRAR